MRFSLSCTSVIQLCLGFSGARGGSADQRQQGDRPAGERPASVAQDGATGTATGEKRRRDSLFDSRPPAADPSPRLRPRDPGGPSSKKMETRAARPGPGSCQGCSVVACLLAGPPCAHVAVSRGGSRRPWLLRRAHLVHADHAFVLIDAELPSGFLRSLGVCLENDWIGSPPAPPPHRRGA